MLTLQDKIDLKVIEITGFADILPGAVIINDIRSGVAIWMNKKGLKELGITLDEMSGMSAKDYYSKYFNEEDAKDYVPKILELVKQNIDEESITFFQQVRINNQEKWVWHISSTKILMRDDEYQPVLLLTISFPIDSNHAMTSKAAKLLEENNFLRKNLHEFAKLTPRETEVLKHIAIGKNAIECGKDLFISPQTVDTHRKNIRKKLGTSSFFELFQYAKSFDLI
jgi:DNA-binding CsgD family transcriptional regulator